MTIYNIRLVSIMVNQFCAERQKWNYHLVVISALIISTSAFVFGISSDRYVITPYKFAEGQFENVPWLKVLE